MSAKTNESSLAKKLAEVMAAVERVAKRGHNDFHGYDYATEADIVATVRNELAQRSIVLVPSCEAETREPVGEKGDVLTSLDLTFTFIDGETSETLPRKWRGWGTDKGDKGGYKAMTGGLKYFLLKFFQIPTGDDPEADGPKETEPARAKPIVQAQTTAQDDGTTINTLTGEVLPDLPPGTVRLTKITDNPTNNGKPRKMVEDHAGNTYTLWPRFKLGDEWVDGTRIEALVEQVIQTAEPVLLETETTKWGVTLQGVSRKVDDADQPDAALGSPVLDSAPPPVNNVDESDISF